jgi:hypothetical protein
MNKIEQIGIFHILVLICLVGLIQAQVLPYVTITGTLPDQRGTFTTTQNRPISATLTWTDTTASVGVRILRGTTVISDCNAVQNSPYGCNSGNQPAGTYTYEVFTTRASTTSMAIAYNL